VRGISRRSALIGLAAAWLVLFALLAALDGLLWDEGGPGIVGFELAGFDGSSDEIVREWGDDGRAAARWSLIVDYLYLAVYGAFWALAAAGVRDGARRRGWDRFERLGRVAVLLAIAAPLMDALENACLLVALETDGGRGAALAGALFATGKFIASTLAIGFVLVALVRLAHARWRTRTRIALAAVALLVVLGLALVTASVERETKDASADGGRIVALPQGEIHVREDGDPSDPPLVLIHGFAASMRWWDAITPLLARERYVVRIDLLGHGGSEKPREGYSMESQADVVASVLDELVVERAHVVGHSMGGLVATALLERHPERVERLITIGTPPDAEAGRDASPVERLGFLPVAGHVGWRFVASDDYVRNGVEETFVPEFDPPERIYEDPTRLTYTAFRDSREEAYDYRNERPLQERLPAAGAGERLPLMVLFGSEDDVLEPDSLDDFRSIPGADVRVVDGPAHSPQIEAPERTARLILEFAR
jgi:pimeloyl-ACP methyl ester carboxylesterase